MSRRGVVLLFALYFVAAAIYGAFHAPHYDFVRITFWAVGYAFVTYVASGIFPFAVWAATRLQCGTRQELIYSLGNSRRASRHYG